MVARFPDNPHNTVVSILVFVELALDVIAGSWSALPSSQFQSLFSWNLLLMPAGRCSCSRTQDVSILVFVELALDERLFFVLFPV